MENIIDTTGYGGITLRECGPSPLGEGSCIEAVSGNGGLLCKFHNREIGEIDERLLEETLRDYWHVARTVQPEECI